MSNAAEDQELPTLPVSDTNLDDAGELDYEPSEPSANSIKDAVSDDEEEGEAGDSDHEQNRPSVTTKEHQQGAGGRQQSLDDEGIVSGPEHRSDDADEFSGPEEGEVDEMEEGEVKDESDEGSEGEEKESGQRQKRFVVDSKQYQARARGDDQQKMQQRRAPIKAPSPSSTSDAKSSNDNRSEESGVCKFYLRGQCTWGSFCKFLHPSGGDRPKSPTDGDPVRRAPDPPVPTPTTAPVPLMTLKTDPPPSQPTAISARLGSPASESAWERGLKQARERIKRATEKKEIDPDFERKRLNMPLSLSVGSDDTSAAVIVDQLSPSYRPAPRPLMDFGRGGDRFSDEGQLGRPSAPSSEPMEPISRQQHGRDPYADDYGNGDRPVYERRHPAQPLSMGRGGRDSVDEPYGRPQAPAPTSRRPESQDRYYGMERRDGAAAVGRERAQYGRDDYPAAPIGIHRSSQEALSPQSSAAPFYHQRHPSSDYGGQQDRRVGERPDYKDRDERDVQRRRLEPEPQGWEYRRSPPAYYRDRDPDYNRAQENVGRRNYDNDRQYRADVDARRPPMQHQQMQQRPNDRMGHADNRGPQQQQQQQQQYRPPNYHYYRTLQQQQQYKNRNRTGDQERKVGGDYNRDKEKMQLKGRHDYNYHYYQTRDRQQNQQQQQQQQQGATGGSGRPLPYERPAYTRQEHRGQWRDPWRRSTSPGSRRGTTVGSDQRHSSLSKRASRDDDRSASNSPDFEKRRRRMSGSSSASRSSGSSRSRSSHDSMGRKDAPLRKRSADSSGSSLAGSPGRRDQLRRSSGSPGAEGRSGRYDRYKRPSRDRSPIRPGRKDTSDVASRAAAKALGIHRDLSRSPFGDDSPRAYRRGGSDSLGGRPSSAGSRNSGQAQHRPISPLPRDQSPEAGGHAPPTRPLSPPPPAPFLATATVRVGAKDGKPKQGAFAQRQEQPRKPIKMTIANKSKVRTNIYENSPEDDDPSPVQASEPIEDITAEQIPLSPVGSPEAELDEEPAPKKMRPSADSGSGSGGENQVLSRREELLRQLRAVEHAIDAKRKKDKGKP